jgi:type I restriction enzyme S subunit
MPTTDSGPWMVTAADVRDGRIDFGSARHTSQEAFDNDLTDKSRVRIGDVLLTKDGSLGRIAVVDRPDVCINQSVAVLRSTSHVRPPFLAWALRAPAMQVRLMLDVGGSAVKHIYITKVAETRFLLPPLSVQDRIVAVLDAVEGMATAAQVRTDACARLSRTILARGLEER